MSAWFQLKNWNSPARLNSARNLFSSAQLGNLQLELITKSLLISLIFIIYRLSSCGSSVTQNITYIQNPSYPTAYATTGTCVFSVTPISSGIIINNNLINEINRWKKVSFFLKATQEPLSNVNKIILFDYSWV